MAIFRRHVFMRHFDVIIIIIYITLRADAVVTYSAISRQRTRDGAARYDSAAAAAPYGRLFAIPRAPLCVSGHVVTRLPSYAPRRENVIRERVWLPAKARRRARRHI